MYGCTVQDANTTKWTLSKMLSNIKCRFFMSNVILGHILVVKVMTPCIMTPPANYWNSFDLWRWKFENAVYLKSEYTYWQRWHITGHWSCHGLWVNGGMCHMGHMSFWVTHIAVSVSVDMFCLPGSLSTLPKQNLCRFDAWIFARSAKYK